MIGKNIENPWKGLNFYVEGEVLYGRAKEIESLSQYIINNSQTVLYGKSGIGKSSILNAGIFPIARKHGMTPVGIRLDHKNNVPYVEQIKNAIQAAGGKVIERLAAINLQNETLWEYLHRNTFTNEKGETTELLLVFDQFEEIFTLQKDENVKKDFFSQLADLLNGVTPAYITESILPYSNENATENQITLDDLDELVIDEGADEKVFQKSYLQDDRFHIVITLREDFLSYLERYTKYIPVMKSNRYALQPINEEQAKDIIMEPVEGLVDIDVAKLIIEKVTGRTDFKLNDAPEIDVDAAVLSLFLSRIYIKRDKDASKITATLVNESSKDIIKDFYEESISDLPTDEVEKIEDQLITYDGRRNNVSHNDLIREGISEKVITTLVEERKLLREFSYQNDIRIEFMHDILCPIVNDRIEHREQLAREKEEQRVKAEEDARRERERKIKLMVWSASAVLVIVGLTGLALWLNSKAKRDQETAEELRRQIGIINVNISLVEEAAVKSLWWEARLKVTTKIGGKDSVINRLVDKTKIDSTFTIPVNSDVHLSLTYSSQTRFEEQEFDILKDSLIKKPFIEVPIKLTAPIKYGGQLVMNDSITNKKYCVKNAMVILNNEVDFTDANGMFLFLLQDSVGNDDEIIIIKKDYGIRYEKPQDKIIAPKNPQFQTIPMELKDMVNYFAIKDSCERIDSLIRRKDWNDKWNIIKNQPIRYIGLKDHNDNDKPVIDNLVLFVKGDKEMNRIWGIYNYGKDSKLGAFSYHFFEGRMSESRLDSTDMLKYRYFEIISKDIANNEEVIKGRKLSTKNEWDFKIFMHSQQVAESVKQ